MRISKNGLKYRGTTIKKCKYCGIEFEAIKLKTQFCSISCANKSRKPEYVRYCPSCGILLKYKYAQSYCESKNKNKKCISCVQKGKHVSDEVKQKISNSLFGRTHSNNTKRKLRVMAIKRIEQNKNNGNQISPNYNPKSIPILEQKAKELGITDLQHAENGGEYYIKELGYWVDGYSPSKNIVIEYYEKHHEKQKERDERRKQEIIKLLKCNFYEIKQ